MAPELAAQSKVRSELLGWLLAGVAIVVILAALGYALKSSLAFVTYSLIALVILLLLALAVTMARAITWREDATELKRAEEELRASEERFRTLIENAPIAIGIGRRGLSVYANKKYLEIYGYASLQEVQGRPVPDYWAPQSRAEIEEIIRKRIMGVPHPMEYEGMAQRKDGSQFPVQMAATVVELADGPATFGFFWDLTERNRVESSLRNRDKELLEAQRLAHVGFWEWVVATDAGKWSEEVYRIFGRDLNLPPPNYEEAAAYWTPESRALLDAAVRNILQTGAAYQLDLELLRPDGEKRWILNKGEAERGTGGNIEKLHGALQDITERKKAEEALRDSEERYRLLFERNLAGVIRTNLNGQVLECNQSFARIHGYASVEEVMAVNSKDFYYDVASRTSFLNQLMQDKMVVGFESHARRKDGKPAWVLVSASLVEDERQGPTILATVFDITRWRELGEQLRQAQKMDAVGRLAGGVAHDFNNMLQIINGYSELLLDELPAEDPSRELVKEIKNSVERSAALTRQLLAFSRQQVMTPEILDLNKVIHNSNKMVRRLIGEDIELIMLEGAGLSTVRADSGRIDQVILNLAVNARDAMPDGGKLTFETANVEVDEDFARVHVPMTPGPYVMLRVSDTGCGMDEETRTRLFEPFFTTKQQGKGTGLGLATVYGIVKQSGGFVWVRSELGLGTSFTIYLPPAEGDVRFKEVSVDAEIAGGSETVLIVEDEKDIRWLMRKVVEGKGYTVLEAHDGMEALHVADRHEGAIHLLLTDMVMPGISGPALAEQMTTRRPELKVLYMSGYTGDSAHRPSAMTLSAAYLQKPFAPEALARKVREVLDSRPA
jgi:PAS domain S-box-containing protein